MEGQQFNSFGTATSEWEQETKAGKGKILDNLWGLLALIEDIYCTQRSPARSESVIFHDLKKKRSFDADVQK